MKTHPQCVECFERQASDACLMADVSTELYKQIMESVRRKIKNFPSDHPPVEMASDIHELVRSLAGVEDPYAKIKEKSNKVSRAAFPPLRELIKQSSEPFLTAVKTAIAGNVIDFGAFSADQMRQSRIIDKIENMAEEPLIGDTAEELHKAVNSSEQILFIGDNAGECFFDYLLLEQLPLSKVVYAVRGGPVLNDATIKDAQEAGIPEICQVQDTGDQTPGVVLERSSQQFIRTLKNSDLVIAKGQGNYESLSEYSDRTYAFLTKVKCDVIAQDIGFEKGSNVIRINWPDEWITNSNKSELTEVIK
ncbi:MAG: damage-control phosphatase ARMT1 family protein [Lentisphaeria bacterium]